MTMSGPAANMVVTAVVNTLHRGVGQIRDQDGVAASLGDRDGGDVATWASATEADGRDRSDGLGPGLPCY
jgi:hypothetical protein